MEEIFQKNTIKLEKNTAYRLNAWYPCEDICKQYRSNFLEVTKWSLAIDEHIDIINTNSIVFDEKKCEKFAQIFADFTREFLNNKYHIIWKK